MEEQNFFKDYDPDVMTACCVPTVCHVGDPILLDDLSESVKLSCNNEHCLEGTYMHKICFDQWQETVLTFLRSTGRARSWSEKQRLQNLWTKKGYDLAYKACGCKCGKGHLRKDLDWLPPPPAVKLDEKKKKMRKKKNHKPCLSLTGNANQNKSGLTSGCQAVPVPRIRSSSISSSGSGSGSPSSYPAVNELPQSPFLNATKPSILLNHIERCNIGGIFSRRSDYSSFNTLPCHKINSYHIKMEDEQCQGNDEIRCFILSMFSVNKVNRILCIFCEANMVVFDRYPLIDGTFFISPCQHNPSALPFNTENRVFYLNALCMNCLEGWNFMYHCRYCLRKWDGSDLILGTMYSYDVLAAKPCCVDRLRCNNCCEVIVPENRMQYFSDYSHYVPCLKCGTADFHFVKPLTSFFCKN